MATLGQRIKAARKAAKLTQMQLANSTNLSRSHIGALETDKYNPSLSTLESIAAALNVSVGSLLPESGGVYQDLTAEESTLINNLRKLSPERRQLVCNIADSFNCAQSIAGSGNINGNGNFWNVSGGNQYIK